MPRRYFHRHWIKPHFKSLRHFIRWKQWLKAEPEIFGAERDDCGNRLDRHLSSHLSSHLSRPELDLSSHLNRDLNYHLKVNLLPKTEHQLDISER